MRWEQLYVLLESGELFRGKICRAHTTVHGLSVGFVHS